MENRNHSRNTVWIIAYSSSSDGDCIDQIVSGIYMGEDDETNLLALSTVTNESHLHVHGLLSHRHMKCLVLRRVGNRERRPLRPSEIDRRQNDPVVSNSVVQENAGAVACILKEEGTSLIRNQST